MAHWIFLRGLSRESGHWGVFVRQFERIVPGARVVALDLPGNGRLSNSPSPLAVGTMVDSCRDQLARQGIKPPYSLLGLSMGGMAAVEWVRHWPRDIQAAVLINTSLRPLSPFQHRLLPVNYFRLLKLALSAASDRDWELAVLDMTSNHRGSHVLRQWLALRRQHPVSVTNVVRQLIASARYRAPYTKPDVPLLLLASEQDRLVSVRCSQTIANRWGIPLETHGTAGHDLPLDAGVWVAERVAQWLRDDTAFHTASP